MPLKVTAEGVERLATGTFSLVMSPHRVRSFGPEAPAHGAVSVLIVEGCHYEDNSKQLIFELDSALALNVGSSTQTLIVDGNAGSDQPKVAENEDGASLLGPGDRQFLKMAREELSGEMAEVAEKLLSGVRAQTSGNLKRGKSRNFSETPDNFWYVIVQPRVNELSITVRGPLTHFEGITHLRIKDDRGNTRFKVRSIDDVPAALRLIFRAVRKS